MDEGVGATLNQAWSALAVVLRDAFTFYDIKEIMGLAGLDVTRLARLEQRAGGGASKGQLITALDAEVGSLENAAKGRVLNHVAEEIVSRRPDEIHRLQAYLDRLGWQLVEGRLISIELFDVDELAELPQAAEGGPREGCFTSSRRRLGRSTGGRVRGSGLVHCRGVCREWPRASEQRQLSDPLCKGAQGEGHGRGSA